MQIVVNGQSIAIVDDTLVSNSVNIYECEFEFDSSWDGFAKTSVWQLNSDDPIEVVIDSGVAVIPHEVLENAGILRIGVYGTKDEKVMPTVWGEKRKVHLGTPTGSIGTEPTPSIYAQILAVATEAKDIAEDVQTEWGSVSATAETLPSGSPASVEFENNTFAFGIPQGERGGDGADGFSPIVTVTPITNGHRVTITDAEGVHTFDVLDGADGVGITNIVMNADYTLTITLSNGTSFTTPSIRGEQGEQGETGNGIASITKTATVGKVDTYTITYTDGTATTFDVTNGEVTEASLEEALYDKADVITNTASGTIASFSDGAEMPVKSLEVEINAVQDLHGQANPYPAGGGKNILNPNLIVVEYRHELNADQSIKVLGSDGRAWASVDAIPLKAGTYYIRFFGQTTYAQIRTSDDDYATTVISPQEETEGTFTLAEDGGIKVKFALASTYPQTIKPIISISSITAWSPYENICPISGWNAVNVVRTGKNLFDASTCEVGKWLNVSTGAVENTSTNYALSDYILLKAGANYIITNPKSSRRWFYDLDKNPVSQITNLTFTPPSDGFARYTVAVNEVPLDTIQLEIGSTTTDYEPYNGTTYPISLGSTVYGGVLDVTSGVLKVTHTMADMGTLVWYTQDASAHIYGCQLPDSVNVVVPPYTNRQSGALCSIYPPSTDPSISSNMTDKSWLRNGQFFYVRDTDYANVNDFKASLSGQQLVYELATPQTITLTPTEVITLLGDNNIWADCGDVAVLYRADTKAYIDGTIVDVPLAMIAPIETGTTSSKAYAVGEYFILNGTQFCKAKTAIASGATFTLNTNYTVTTIANELKALQ